MSRLRPAILLGAIGICAVSTVAVTPAGAATSVTPKGGTAGAPKPGKFRGNATAPYDFGGLRQKQDLQFTASGRERVITGVFYLRCSLKLTTGGKETYLITQTMRAKVSKKGKISGKGTTTKGDTSVTQTISGSFTSRTKAKGRVKATYSRTDGRGSRKCVVGGPWTAKRQ